jgi:hypothetical protein
MREWVRALTIPDFVGYFFPGLVAMAGIAWGWAGEPMIAFAKALGAPTAVAVVTVIAYSLGIVFSGLSRWLLRRGQWMAQQEELWAPEDPGQDGRTVRDAARDSFAEVFGVSSTDWELVRRLCRGVVREKLPVLRDHFNHEMGVYMISGNLAWAVWPWAAAGVHKAGGAWLPSVGAIAAAFLVWAVLAFRHRDMYRRLNNELLACFLIYARTVSAQPDPGGGHQGNA